MSATFPDTHSPALWAPLVLAAVTATDTGNGVPFRDVVDHVESLDGFPGWETWGYAKRGRDPHYPRAKRALGLAATLLKDRGELTFPKRGWYAVAAAAEAAPVAAPATVLNKLHLVSAPAEETAAPVVEEAPAAVVEEVPAPVVSDGPATHPLYVASERARKAAIEATACFGFWTTRSRSCKGCPLAGLCHDARGIKVAEVVSTLNAEVLAEEAAAAQQARYEAAAVEAAAVETEAAAVAAEPSMTTETWTPVDSTEVAEEVSAEAEVVAEAAEAAPVAAVVDHTVTQFGWDIACSGCAEMITAGEDIAHVEGKGGFHIGCIPAA